jgi:hypothetical protein
MELLWELGIGWRAIHKAFGRSKYAESEDSVTTVGYIGYISIVCSLNSGFQRHRHEVCGSAFSMSTHWLHFFALGIVESSRGKFSNMNRKARPK